MIGDKLNIEPHHTSAAREVFEAVKNQLGEERTVFTVAGQSGAGKSEIAAELAKFLESIGRKSFIFAQDDYFVHPPKTNHNERLKDINWVGLQEVKLSLLDKHAAAFKAGQLQMLEKPLVIFDEDRISSEKVDLSPFDIAIVEGTYTTTLKNADYHVFIDRDYFDTKEHRLARGRDKIDEFTDKILKIEDSIITKHKQYADFIVSKDYTVEVVEKK
jgi:uridine kinase